MQKKFTFILVHGSFHAAWNWHKVTPLLEAEGHQVISLDLPGHGLDREKIHRVRLAHCVKAVTNAMDGIGGNSDSGTRRDIILVAHSRNGMVISQAAEERSHRIHRLIYIAAYLIPDGKSMMDYAIQDLRSLVLRHVEPAFDGKKALMLLKLCRFAFWRRVLPFLLPTRLKTHHLPAAMHRKALYHDCPEEITRLANVLLTAEPNIPGFEPLRLSSGNYGSIPRVYIKCLRDRAVTPKIQNKMLEDSPCETVISMDTGHSPFFSRPGELTAHILNAIE